MTDFGHAHHLRNLIILRVKLLYFVKRYSWKYLVIESLFSATMERRICRIQLNKENKLLTKKLPIFIFLVLLFILNLIRLLVIVCNLVFILFLVLGSFVFFVFGSKLQFTKIATASNHLLCQF